MNASGKLRIFIVICVLFVTRSEVRSKKPVLKSRLNIEEGDGGSGDPVRKVIENNIPDDTEASGETDDEDDSDGGSGGGSGVGSSGSGAIPTKNITVKPTTIQTVVVINKGEGTTTASTSIIDVTTKKLGISTEFDNSVDPSNPRRNITEVTSSNEIPEVGESRNDNEPLDDSALANSGVNFTVAIIVGVVVGAILSILIIVFLVYRLRKKDEGSYSLDEQSTAMLRADTDSPPKGKEEYYA